MSEAKIWKWDSQAGGGSGALVYQGRVEYEYDHRGERIGRETFDAAGQPLDHEKYIIDRQNPTGYSQAIAELKKNYATGKFQVHRYNTFGDRLLAQTEIQGGTGGGSSTPRLPPLFRRKTPFPLALFAHFCLHEGATC